MRWLNRLLGRVAVDVADPVPTDVSPAATRMDGDTFSITGVPGWFGFYSRSPNNRWLISWVEADGSIQEAGLAIQKSGSYLLYDTLENRVAVRGGMERPNNGHVSNSGVFVLEDWRFDDGPIGTLCAYDFCGRPLLKRTFTANILTSAVSSSGRFAVCHTCMSPSSDGKTLFLFDLATGQQVFAVPPIAGQPDCYTIDEQCQEVTARMGSFGNFRYGPSGKFLDGDVLETASLRNGDYGTVLSAAKSILKRDSASLSRLGEAFIAVERVRQDEAGGHEGWEAAALKVGGVLLERLGNPRKALVLYQLALAANPKIGLKRKIAALEASMQ